MFNEIFITELLNSVPIELMVIGRFLSFFGSLLFFLIIIGVLFLYKEKKEALTLSFGGLITGMIVYGLKFLIRRRRPFVKPGVERFIKVSGYSFPSGHAALAFLLATLLSNFYEKGKYFYILAAFIILSRMMLGVHYLSDVVVGGFIGYIVGKLILKNKDKVFNLVENLP